MSGIFKKFRKDEIQITPFEANKEYTVFLSNYTGSYYEKGYEQFEVFDPWITGSTFNIPQDIRIVSLSVFSYDTQYDGSDFMPTEYGSYLNVTKSSPHAVTTNNFYKRSIHDSIQGMYYTNPDDPCWTLDNNGYEKEIRTLGKSAKVISVPQRIFGESIKKNSVKIQSGSKTITDDGFGNLIDNSIQLYGNPTESISFVTTSLLALNFVDMYNQAGSKLSAHSINALASSSYYRDNGKEYFNIKNKTRFFERSPYPNRVEAYNITPNTSSDAEQTFIELDGIKPATTKSRINLENQSLLRVKHRHQFDYRVGKTRRNTNDDDFAVYVRVSSSRFQESQSADFTDQYHHNYIISKHDPHSRGAFPFSIRYVNKHAIENSGSTSIGNAGTYQAAISDGVDTLYLNSPTVVSTSNAFDSVLLTKSGSFAYLYVNGVLQSHGSIPSGSLFNDSDIILGARPNDAGTKFRFRDKKTRYSRKFRDATAFTNHFKGGISNVMLFNKNITAAEAGWTSTYPTMENKVGNVFYNHGLLTFTAPITNYSNDANHIFSECTLSFKNTHTIIEHEYACHIKEREYGFTMNPTIIDDQKQNTILPFVTGSEWAPYVTTVGLYDDNARLLAIGKLSRAIKKSNDYDTTFIVAFDT